MAVHMMWPPAYWHPDPYPAESPHQAAIAPSPAAVVAPAGPGDEETDDEEEDDSEELKTARTRRRSPAA